MSTRFLYYFFLCLCKSFKELALYAITQDFERKRMQRYDYFLNHQNF